MKMKKTQIALTIEFILLVVFGVRELIRGNLMAPAASLFWYAFQMLMNSDEAR